MLFASKGKAATVEIKNVIEMLHKAFGKDSEGNSGWTNMDSQNLKIGIFGRTWDLSPNGKSLGDITDDSYSIRVGYNSRNMSVIDIEPEYFSMSIWRINKILDKPIIGKNISKSVLSDNDLKNENRQSDKYDEIDHQILHLIKNEGKLAATKYCKETKNLGLKVAKEYVDKIAFDNGLGKKPIKSEGCFIATACYGDYDAPEVIVLRKYRDEVLYQTEAGKIFIKIYYSVSPTFAKVIRQSVYFRNITRRILLKPLISRIEKNTNR